MLLSQHVETRHSVDLVALGGFGYAKDRVLDLGDFLDALARVAAGGSALDPEVVGRLIGRRDERGSLARLTPREKEVLALMAEGRTNLGIARRLHLTARTVEAHTGSILAKLGLAATTRPPPGASRTRPSRPPPTSVSPADGVGSAPRRGRMTTLATSNQGGGPQCPWPPSWPQPQSPPVPAVRKA